MQGRKGMLRNAEETSRRRQTSKDAGANFFSLAQLGVLATMQPELELTTDSLCKALPGGPVCHLAEGNCCATWIESLEVDAEVDTRMPRCFYPENDTDFLIGTNSCLWSARAVCTKVAPEQGSMRRCDCDPYLDALVCIGSAHPVHCRLAFVSSDST